MPFAAPRFTSRGKNLQLRALDGEAIVFTKIQMGDGAIGDASIADLTELRNPVVTLPLRSIMVSEDGYATVSAYFNNSSLSDGFYWREIGLFAQDPDNRDHEILYCYQNAGSTANYIAEPGSEVIEKLVKIIAVVDDAENVTAILNESAVFATIQEVEQITSDHNTDPTAHTVILGDKTVYVRGTAAAGGDGTSSNPFKTIEAAIQSLPRSLNSATVYIAAGSYDEDVVISGYKRIRVAPWGSGTVTINSVNCSFCLSVDVSGIKVVGASADFAPEGYSAAIACRDVASFKLSSSSIESPETVDENSVVGFYAKSSIAAVDNTLVKTVHTGFVAGAGSVVSVKDITFVGTLAAFHVSAESGGVVLVDDDALDVDAWNGGLILNPTTKSNLSDGVYDAHLESTANPHSVTLSQIGIATGVLNSNVSPYTVTIGTVEIQNGSLVSIEFKAGFTGSTLSINGTSYSAFPQDYENDSFATNPIEAGEFGLFVYRSNIGFVLLNLCRVPIDLTKAEGTLAVDHGGTGATSLSQGSLLYGNGTDAVGQLSGVGALFAAASGSPEFGTLPIACGGTGRTTTGIGLESTAYHTVRCGSIQLPGGILICWGQIRTAGSTTYYHNFTPQHGQGVEYQDANYALTYSGQDDVWGSLTRSTTGFSLAVGGVSTGTYVADWIAIGLGKTNENNRSNAVQSGSLTPNSESEGEIIGEDPGSGEGSGEGSGSGEGGEGSGNAESGT